MVAASGDSWYVALCGMKFIHLEPATVKIFGTYVSHNVKLENDENYRKHMVKKKLLNIWRMRQLSIED